MEFLGFVITILIFGAFIVFYLLYLIKGKAIKDQSKKPYNKDLILEKWANVQAMMAQGGPANYRQAILEADKIVDTVLRSKIVGENMGDRLKNARHLFTRHTYDRLWAAHKIRNKVAHDINFEGLSSDAKLAVRNFEKALKELRVL